MSDARLTAIAESLSIPRVERHIFMCADSSAPKCAPLVQTAEVWKYLKTRLKELGLASAPPLWQGTPEFGEVTPGEGCVLRSKVDCLRICEQGPIAVVYPEGVWYHHVTVEVMERIVVEHLMNGQEVSEFVFARKGTS